MFSADFSVPGWGTSALGFDTTAQGPLFGTDPTPEPGAYGAAGGMPSGIETPFLTGSFWDLLSTSGTATLPPVQIGPGGAERAIIAEELRAADAAAAADYISDLPGEVGEAAGEFVAELGAGVGSATESVIGGVTAPITAIPGDLFEGIPTWVPLLGAAYLLTRN